MTHVSVNSGKTGANQTKPRRYGIFFFFYKTVTTAMHATVR